MRCSFYFLGGYYGIWGIINDLSIIKFCVLMLEGIGLKVE